MNSSKESGNEARTGAQGPDRRDGERTITIYRLVQILHGGDQGFARCRNISDTGMKLDLTMPVALDGHIEIRFSPTVALHARVIWGQAGSCGVEFVEPIDSASILASTAVESRGFEARSPRLEIVTTATISYEGVTREIIVRDVSLKGLKLDHFAGLNVGQRVQIALRGQSARLGVVRWIQGQSAGLMLMEPFSVEELGSLRSICMGQEDADFDRPNSAS